MLKDILRKCSDFEQTKALLEMGEFNEEEKVDCWNNIVYYRFTERVLVETIDSIRSVCHMQHRG